MSIMDHLIDPDTGEIDSLVLIEAADLRAQREWGGPVPPPAFTRAAITFVHDRASDLRREWRRARGLPDDSTTTMTVLPDWGSAGDSYGRH
jgi:hypothetical protein